MSAQYLGPYLREVLLAELTTAHLQAMIAAVIRRHHAPGTPVSAATLTRIRATLRAALNAAIRRGLISDIPAATVELPRARRPRAVVSPFRVDQWRLATTASLPSGGVTTRRRTGEGVAVAVWTAAPHARRGHGRACKRSLPTLEGAVSAVLVVANCEGRHGTKTPSAVVL
jgi:hypothetical protein